MKINVTQPLQPDREMFHNYVDEILDSGWLTNRGKCVRALEKRLQSYLGVRNVVLVSNGTLALQVAFRALELTGEVITSPFTFIATASAAKWEGLDVIFSDIDAKTLNLSCEHVEQKITSKTSAIMPVHVFGNPCEVLDFERLAGERNLKVIYDAAHAFAVRLNGESIMNWGDISILSFHATKLFHTIEGGALIINDDSVCSKVRKMINFGFNEEGIPERLGINAKMNEFQAAMGLCLLENIDSAIEKRAEMVTLYDALLPKGIRRQQWTRGASKNCAYYPVVFDSEEETQQVQNALNSGNIFPRRYFYPSLDTLNFITEGQNAPVSRDISRRILCLPLFADLTASEVERIIKIISQALKE